MSQIILLFSFLGWARHYEYARGAFLFQSLKRNQTCLTGRQEARHINSSPQASHPNPLICQSTLLRKYLSQFYSDINYSEKYISI